MENVYRFEFGNFFSRLTGLTKLIESHSHLRTKERTSQCPGQKRTDFFSSKFLMKRISGLLSQHAAHDDEDGLAADGESPSLGCSDATLSDPDDLFCCTSLLLTSTRWVR